MSEQQFEVTEGDGYFSGSIARYSYTLDGTAEQEARLSEIATQMGVLNRERTTIFNEISYKNLPAAGWEIERITEAHGGRCCVTYKRTVEVEKLKPATTKTALDLALEKVDAKTLFHSNVLTREEKRTLLGLSNAATPVNPNQGGQK